MIRATALEEGQIPVPAVLVAGKEALSQILSRRKAGGEMCIRDRGQVKPGKVFNPLWGKGWAVG